MAWIIIQCYTRFYDAGLHSEKTKAEVLRIRHLHPKRLPRSCLFIWQTKRGLLTTLCAPSRHPCVHLLVVSIGRHRHHHHTYESEMSMQSKMQPTLCRPQQKECLSSCIPAPMPRIGRQRFPERSYHEHLPLLFRMQSVGFADRTVCWHFSNPSRGSLMRLLAPAQAKTTVSNISLGTRR